MRSARSEQPFPDSWIATTASIALGVLTDIASEVVLPYGVQGREKLWPLILEQYTLWYLGRLSDESGKSTWKPCEALVRAACRELHRFPQRVIDAADKLGPDEALSWVSVIWRIFTDLLDHSLTIEQTVQSDLLTYKMIALGIADDSSRGLDPPKKVTSKITTPYGRGRLQEQRTVKYEGQDAEYVVNVVRLGFGGTLYCLAADQTESGKKPFLLETKYNCFSLTPWIRSFGQESRTALRLFLHRLLVKPTLFNSSLN